MLALTLPSPTCLHSPAPRQSVSQLVSQSASQAHLQLRVGWPPAVQVDGEAHTAPACHHRPRQLCGALGEGGLRLAGGLGGSRGAAGS